MWNFHIETASERIFSPDNVAEWVALYNQCDTHVFNHPHHIHMIIPTFAQQHKSRATAFAFTLTSNLAPFLKKGGAA